MKYFAETVIKPFLIQNHSQRVCEIGASLGKNTDALLELDSIQIAIVDPCLDADLCRKFRNNKRVRVHKGQSRVVLETISERFDCILIDGDHNWFTVYNELCLIHKRRLLREQGAIFLHDIGWPYGRRDMYYRPEWIPAEFVHPYERKGIVYGRAALSSRSEFNRDLCNATEVGGKRNGVLTAIDDFLRAKPGRYRFVRIREEFGLGVLYPLLAGNECLPSSAG